MGNMTSKGAAQTGQAQSGQTQSGQKKPYRFLWMVEERKAADGTARSFWTKVGVAFENRDGSFSLELAAFPANGRLQMREPAPREAEAAA